MRDGTGTVYIIKNTENKKVYIGQTALSLEKRLQNHIKESKNKRRKPKNGLHQAMLKIGFDKFYIEPLKENVPIERIYEEESKYILLFNSNKNGYNVRFGGKGGVIFSEKEEQEILDLAMAKTPSTVIAKQYNVHKATIQRVLKKHGFSYNNVDDFEIKKLVESGIKNKEIAKRLGVHPQTISRRLKKLGIKRYNAKIADRNDLNYESLIEDYYNQMDIKDICLKYNITKGVFYKIKKNRKISSRPIICKRWKKQYEKSGE